MSTTHTVARRRRKFFLEMLRSNFLLKVPITEFFLFSHLNLNITLRTSVKNCSLRYLFSHFSSAIGSSAYGSSVSSSSHVLLVSWTPSIASARLRLFQFVLAAFFSGLLTFRVRQVFCHGIYLFGANFFLPTGESDDFLSAANGLY